jgi:drug/metabolite transporter (DMT)-like permease
VPAAALALALAAAVIHAGWNLLIARAPDPEATGAAAQLVGVVAFAPVAVLTWRVGWDAAPYIGASAALELAYFVLLAGAYRRTDLSLVYPIARGLAPVLVLLGAAVATGARPTALEVAGVLGVAAGIVLVRGRPAGGGAWPVAVAVGIAICIAAYTIVDKSGLRHASAIPYFELVLGIQATIYAGSLAAIRGPGVIRVALTPAAAAAGIGMFGAYALVLAALRLAPAASVAAVRETSVVIATGLAAAVLGERVTRARVAGAILVAAGVALLAVA